MTRIIKMKCVKTLQIILFSKCTETQLKIYIFRLENWFLLKFTLKYSKTPVFPRIIL